MAHWIARLRDLRFIRYVLASVAALAADVGSFLAFMAFGVAAAGASALGYSIGIVVHWLFSSRTVFQDSVSHERKSRTMQKALFVVSALVGLALTIAIVGLADAAGFDPRIAKLFAIVVSFAGTWLLRAKIVFRASEVPQEAS